MQCPRCSGKGTVTKGYGGPGTCIGRDWYEEECDLCKGIGAVKHVGKDVDQNGRRVDYYDPDYNSKKGGCFLTTACLANCRPHDAENTLNVLRHFRDTFLLTQPQGREMIADYYALAPKIVDAIDASRNSDEIYRDLYKRLVVPCVQSIRQHDQRRAMATYITMFSDLRHQFLAAPDWEQGGGI